MTPGERRDVTDVLAPALILLLVWSGAGSFRSFLARQFADGLVLLIVAVLAFGGLCVMAHRYANRHRLRKEDELAKDEWWYVVANDKRVGPVSFGVLEQLVAAGHLVKSQPVWRDGMTGWTTAERIPGLFDATPSPGPGIRSNVALDEAAPISTSIRRGPERSVRSVNRSFEMNRAQRRITGVVACATLAMLLYPHFRIRGAGGASVPQGYSFLWAPPLAAELDSQRLMLQWVALWVAGAACWALAKKSK